MKAAHLGKIQRRLDVAVTTLLPESTVRGEVINPDTRLRRLLARLDSAEFDGKGRPESGWRSAASDIITLLETDVPELMDAVRQAQGAQRKYCRYCGERRLGLIVDSRDEHNAWECRDADGCEFRQNLREQRDQPPGDRPEDPRTAQAVLLRFYADDDGPCATWTIFAGSDTATLTVPAGAQEVTISWADVPAGVRSGRPEDPGEIGDGVT